MAGSYNRQDRLYRKAKEEGYRSRAAYKLIELDQKYKLFRKGAKVLDLGCFPGGWLQVALEKVGPQGTVVGIDLRDVVPVTDGAAHAKFIMGDLYEKEMREALLAEANGKVHVVLSDMSPQLTGIRFADVARSFELAQLAESVAHEALVAGGALVVKLFPGQESEDFCRGVKKCFAGVSRLALDASRKSSNEFYLIAKGFRPEAVENRQESSTVLQNEGLHAAKTI